MKLFDPAETARREKSEAKRRNFHSDDWEKEIYFRSNNTSMIIQVDPFSLVFSR